MSAAAGGIAERRPAAGVGARLRADPGLRLALGVALAMRVVLGLWALVALGLHGSGASPEAHQEAGTSTGSAIWPLVGPWERWDGLWYLHIASGGYPAGGPEAAFAPLFPLLARTAALATGGDVSLGAWLVASLALVGALWATWHLVDDVLGPVVARRTVVLMALYPAAFFLVAPYPEGLFLALSAGALLAARRGSWGWAAVAGTLAVLDRPQGAVVVVAVGVEALMAARRRPDGSGGPVARLRALGAGPLLATALPALALAAWFAYCRVHLGLALGPLTALRTEWGHRAAWPWQVVADSVRTIAGGHHMEEIANLGVAAAVLALLPVMARRLPASWTVYTALALAFSLCNEPEYTPLMSLTRYAAVLVPVFALVASFGPPTPIRRPWQWAAGAGALAVAAAALQADAIDAFVHHVFVA